MSHEFLFKSWVEFWFFVTLVAGFIIALLSGSAVVSYVIIFICGMMSGRLIFERREKFVAPYYLIIVGFLIGFMVGTPWGDDEVVVILYILGILLGYEVVSKGWLHDVRY